MQRKLKNQLLAMVASVAALVMLPSAAYANSCPVKSGSLNEFDRMVAEQAWKYFEANTQPTTGLVNAGFNFPSTTIWDTGASIAAFITAEAMGLITKEEFDKRMRKMLDTLAELDLFYGVGPNKVYHTVTGAKVDYGNNPSETGIGISALDVGRLLSWLNILACLHPEHKLKAEAVVNDWSYCRMVNDGRMYGMGTNKAGEPIMLQEGRFGYEQYASKAFKNLGFPQQVASTYNNKYKTTFNVEGIDIAVDKRTRKELGAYGYIVTESFTMDQKEHGKDSENTPLMENIYAVQQKRWERTGIVTAVSEDNVDRPPYFVYNTIYVEGKPWQSVASGGREVDSLRSTSTKAAFSLAYTYPDRPYSKVLLDYVQQAKDPRGGWYSGIYENKEMGLNKATTANTNGVILSLMLYKMYGSLNQVCKNCNQGVWLNPEKLAYWNDQQRCLKDVPKLEQKNKLRAERLKRKQWDLELQSLFALVDRARTAQTLAVDGQGEEASKTLKGIKGGVWGASRRYSDEKKALLGLMGPIDKVANAWKRGSTTRKVDDITTKLTDIFERIRDNPPAR